MFAINYFAAFLQLVNPLHFKLLHHTICFEILLKMMILSYFINRLKFSI